MLQAQQTDVESKRDRKWVVLTAETMKSNPSPLLEELISISSISPGTCFPRVENQGKLH